jgi:hypothetical protein
VDGNTRVVDGWVYKTTDGISHRERS